jgi:hypothetical protein
LDKTQSKRSYSRFTEARRKLLFEAWQQKIQKEGKRKGERELQDDLAYEFNADVRTIQRNLKKALVDSEKHSPKVELLQAAHIGSLQRLASWAREAVDHVKITETTDDLDPQYVDLLMIAFQLTNDALWPQLAGHLGDKATKIEKLANELEGSPFQHSSMENRKERVARARQLLNDVLIPLVISGDTRDWSEFGINQVCPWCPIQET